MISSDNRRYAYGKSQLIEVICQLRFPTILSIDTRARRLSGDRARGISALPVPGGKAARRERRARADGQ